MLSYTALSRDLLNTYLANQGDTTPGDPDATAASANANASGQAMAAALNYINQGLNDYAINASIDTDIKGYFANLRSNIENQYGCFPDETNPWGALFLATIIQTSNNSVVTNSYQGVSEVAIAKSPLDAVTQFNNAGGLSASPQAQYGGPNDSMQYMFYWASFS
jgi:hypothetical protein